MSARLVCVKKCAFLETPNDLPYGDGMFIDVGVRVCYRNGAVSQASRMRGSSTPHDFSISSPIKIVFVFVFIIIIIILYLETEGRHANAKAQEAVDHLASIISSTKEISQSRIKCQPLP